MANYQDLKKQFEGIATAAGSTTGRIDEEVLKKIIAGTHGSYSVKDDTIVRQAGEGYVAPPKPERDTNDEPDRSPRPRPSTRKQQRTELLVPEQRQTIDYTGRAREQVSPAYDRLLTQLRSDVESTRGAIPRRLLARGQSVGGQRTLQEGELDRQLAYGTADIESQRQQAIQQQAQALRQQDAQAQQQQFENQLSLRQMQLQEQGFNADQAYRQAQLEMQQQGMQLDTRQQAFNEYAQNRQLELQEQGFTADQAWRQAQLELEQMQMQEGARQFDEQQQYKYWYGNQQFSGYGGAGSTQPTQEQEDVSDYRQYIESYLINDPNSVISYINNLESTRAVSPQGANRLRSIYGIQAQTAQTQTTGTGRVGGSLEEVGGTIGQTMIRPPTQDIENDDTGTDTVGIDMNNVSTFGTTINDKINNAKIEYTLDNAMNDLIGYYMSGAINSAEGNVIAINLGLNPQAFTERVKQELGIE